MARIFAGVTPTSQEFGGGLSRNVGTKFTTSTNGTWAGWHIWKPTTFPPTTYRLGLWNNAGTLLDDVTVSAASLSTGDNLVPAGTSGITLTSAAGPYTVGMFISGGGPDFEDASGTLTSARTVGNLTAVASGALFTNMATFQRPTSTYDGYFFVDPEVTFGGAVFDEAATLDGSGTLTADARRVALMAAGLSGDGTATAIPRVVLQSSAVLDGTSELTTAARVVHQLAVTLSGDGTLTATEQRGGSAVTTGPCESWEAIWSCDLSTEAMAVTGVALEAASEVLYALSGRRFGLCTVTLRPCRRDCFGDVWPYLTNWWEFGSGGPMPLLFRGSWFNITCGTCMNNCSCSIVSEVALPGPVFDVTTVKVDGVTLSSGTDYRLDENRLLVRLGGAEWPRCNDLNLDDSQVGTWSVTARFGEDVPTLGKMAVGSLAAELAKAIACDDSCGLPAPVQSIARQGVNLTFLDPNQVFADGRTGLYLPDLFISTYNPNGLNQPSTVYNLDADPPRRVG